MSSFKNNEPCKEQNVLPIPKKNKPKKTKSIENCQKKKKKKGNCLWESPDVELSRQRFYTYYLTYVQNTKGNHIQ